MSSPGVYTRLHPVRSACFGALRRAPFAALPHGSARICPAVDATPDVGPAGSRAKPDVARYRAAVASAPTTWQTRRRRINRVDRPCRFDAALVRASLACAFIPAHSCWMERVDAGAGTSTEGADCASQPHRQTSNSQDAQRRMGMPGSVTILIDATRGKEPHLGTSCGPDERIG